MSIDSMEIYRNPEGVRVGQTWIAKNPIPHQPETHTLTIEGAFTKNIIFVKLANGISGLRVDEAYLKAHYTRDSNFGLFGDDNDN